MTNRWFLNANEGCIMTPSLLVQVVQVSMLSTKWILWAELVLPRVGHQARTLAVIGQGTHHPCGRHSQIRLALNCNIQNILGGACLMDSSKGIMVGMVLISPSLSSVKVFFYCLKNSFLFFCCLLHYKSPI